MTLKEYLSKTYESLPDELFTVVKNALYFVFAFLQIDADIVRIIAILMAVDTCTGIIKSIVLHKVNFSFKSLFYGIMTKFVLMIIPMTLALIALGLGYDFTWAVDGVLRLIVLSEGISIFTNFLSIKDRKNIENKDYLSIILHTIRNWMVYVFDKIQDKYKGK